MGSQKKSDTYLQFNFYVETKPIVIFMTEESCAILYEGGSETFRLSEVNFRFSNVITPSSTRATQAVHLVNFQT